MFKKGFMPVKNEVALKLDQVRNGGLKHRDPQNFIKPN